MSTDKVFVLTRLHNAVHCPSDGRSRVCKFVSFWQKNVHNTGQPGTQLGHITFVETDHERGYPVSILRKSISGRHRPVRVADGPMTARCRFT